jgi:hypothetical protein
MERKVDPLTNKVRVNINDNKQELSIPIFYDLQGLKLFYAKKHGIPSKYISIEYKYDAKRNDTDTCKPINLDDYYYIIDDLEFESQKLIKNFKTYEDKQNAIDVLKNKYTLYDEQEFVNVINSFNKFSFELNLINKFLNVSPNENFQLQLEKDYEQYDSINKIQKFLADISSASISTDITVLQTDVVINFELSIDLSEFFNQIMITNELPFILYNSFSKVFSSFYELPLDWVNIKSDNTITMYILNTSGIPSKFKQENYTKITLVELSNEDNIYKMQMSIVSKLNDGIKESQLIQRVFKLFPQLPKNCTYRQNEIICEYFLNIKTEKFYEQIFSDYIMLDDNVKNILVSDESDIIIRQKGGFFTYFRYNKNSDNLILLDIVLRCFAKVNLLMGKNFILNKFYCS